MPGYVTREEFEARVGVLEQEVEGEKLVTRHILEQTRLNGDDLAAIKTRLARVETDLGGIKAEVGGLKADVGGLKADLRGLRTEMPKIVGDAMREVLRRDKGK